MDQHLKGKSGRRAALVRERHASKLMRLANVNGVAVGFVETAGEVQPEIGLRVYVDRKIPKDELDPGEIVPPEIDGVRTDVVEARGVHWQGGDDLGARARHSELIGGISGGNQDRALTGTLGGLVFDNETGEPLLLSNWHVLAGSSGARDGEPIVQPGHVDGGFEQVGELLRWRFSARMDAAVARAGGRRFLSAGIRNVGALTGSAEPKLGMGVRKSGRTTGLTRGVITAVDATRNLGGSTIRGAFEVTGQWRVGAPGDSGSLVVDSSNRAIGIIVGGADDSTRAWAFPMAAVERALQIHVVAPTVLQNSEGAQHALLF